MSETTKIEWATSTGNPWIGCTKVSPGCKNCYAEALDHQRFSRTMGGGTKEKPVSHWGKGAPRFRTKGFWKDALKWNKHATGMCSCESGDILPGGLCNYCGLYARRPRIFPSLCDWLDEEVPIEWLADFLKLIHDTPNLDWLLLSKRPKNFTSRLQAAVDCLGRTVPDPKSNNAELIRLWIYRNQYPQNVWLGVSVEDQQRANERIPELLKIPAKVRFLSVEPLLDHVNLENWLLPTYKDIQAIYSGENPDHPKIHWVIVGGESGPGARSCSIERIRSIISQCKEANVPVFCKQLGSQLIQIFTAHESEPYAAPMPLKHPKGGDLSEWPEDLRVRQFPQTFSTS